MYQRLRPLIFRMQPESAHHLTVSLLQMAGALPPIGYCLRQIFRPRQPVTAVDAFGLRFSNPIGLAAGYDKDGLAWRGLCALGFGHLELGTVTPLPQPGNPQPRLFRLVEDQAVINRMGFNNRGADFLAARLANRRPGGTVIGVNIGKNKATPLEEAPSDYLKLATVFLPLADYLAVNVSSPNTPGLRSLQSGQALEEILSPLAGAREQFKAQTGKRTPVLVKLSPDLNDNELQAAMEVILSCGMDGVIVANTTTTRPGVHSSLAEETGGLSGAPLASLSQQRLETAARWLNGRLPIIASGGVFCAEDVRRRMDAGAGLVQIYTGLIYEGPGLVRKIIEGMAG